MNMSNKDIALVLQISVDSVFTKKYRLMKKLELPKEMDLYAWLNSL
jgi:DNA-binding CsgD family transcriptional regulator